MKTSMINNFVRTFTIALIFIFAITVVAPANAQGPNFDISNVNSALSSKSKDVKTLMLWLCYIGILVGLGMVALNYFFQMQTAKAGLISFGVGFLCYIIFKIL